MKGKAAIFDLDGVIVDTAFYHYKGWKRLADELGVHFDEDKNEKLRGVDRRGSLIAMLGYTPQEDKLKEWCDKKNSYYLDYIKTITPEDLLPGAVDVLNGLRELGWKLACASSSKNAKTVLDKIGLLGFFDAIVDGKDIKKGKPEPEIFLLASQRVGIDPEGCIVVEDAESGIEAAVRAGMHSIGIGNSEALKKADKIFSKIAEVKVNDFEEVISK